MQFGTKDYPFETISFALGEMVPEIVKQRAVQVIAEGEVKFGKVKNQIEFIDKEIII